MRRRTLSAREVRADDAHRTSRHCRTIRHNATLFLALLLATTVTFATPSYGSKGGLPIPRVLGGRRGMSYKWKSSVDSETMTATSQEQSVIVPSSPLYRTIENTADSDLLRLTTQLVQEYPRWLCRFPITLGFLRAVQGGGPNNNDSNLRMRILRIKLLSFAKSHMNGSRISYQQTGKDMTPNKVTRVSVELPIVGGLLARPPPKQIDKKTKKKKPQTAKTLRNRGSLLFVVKKSTPIRGTSIMTPSSSSMTCTLTSGITGGYRPRMIGARNIPLLTPIRIVTYKMTQSFIHARVMKKFHKYLIYRATKDDEYDQAVAEEAIQRESTTTHHERRGGIGFNFSEEDW